MLENVACIFDNTKEMLKKLKKKTYEERMKQFSEEHGHYFVEMTEMMDAATEGEKETQAQEIAEVFIGAVKEKFEKNGKMNGRKQADLNFFMIYYVFPAILQTEHESATMIADAIRDTWRNSFKYSQISYTDYDTLYQSFRGKIFGIF